MSDITSRPYRPKSNECCEACAFGRGKHAAWCPQGVITSELNYRYREIIRKTNARYDREFTKSR